MSLRSAIILGLLAILAGCAAPQPVPNDADAVLEGPNGVHVRRFATVLDRVGPVAEEACRTRMPRGRCAFRVIIDDTPGQVATAYQTVDRRGNPVIVFTLPLIAEARNADELAFVLGHEAAHHIEDHLRQTESSAAYGAAVLGTLAQAYGQTAEDIEAAAALGAELGARRYSKAFELEADALGAVIAYHAGYDPVLGSAFFSRIPDPGDEFLGTHPPNAERKALVRRVVAELQREG